jgi:hypothetical protein
MSKEKYLVLTRKFNGEDHVLCSSARSSVSLNDCYTLRPLNVFNFFSIVTRKNPEEISSLRDQLNDLVEKNSGSNFKGENMSDFKDLDISELVVSLGTTPFQPKI